MAGFGKEEPNKVTWEKEPQSANEIGRIDPNTSEPNSGNSISIAEVVIPPVVTPTVPTDASNTDTQETIGGDDNAGGVQTEPEPEKEKETEETKKEPTPEPTPEPTTPEKEDKKEPEDTFINEVIIDVSEGGETTPSKVTNSFSASYLAQLRA